MKIINTGLRYCGGSSSAYHGVMRCTRKEFNRIVNKILKDKNVSKYHNGAGKYPYLSKDFLKENLQTKATNTGKYYEYALGVGFAEYCVKNIKMEKSRYHYKRQNYVTQVIN